MTAEDRLDPVKAHRMGAGAAEGAGDFHAGRLAAVGVSLNGAEGENECPAPHGPRYAVVLAVLSALALLVWLLAVPLTG